MYMYIYNDLPKVSNKRFPILFADDTTMLLTELRHSILD